MFSLGESEKSLTSQTPAPRVCGYLGNLAVIIHIPSRLVIPQILGKIDFFISFSVP